jgi:hypothetical protein
MAQRLDGQDMSKMYKDDATVSIAYLPMGEGDTMPYRARIEVAGEEDHNGIGETPAKALLAAAEHWAAYEQ